MGGRPVTPPPLVVVDRAETPTLAGARATRVGAETDLRVVFRCHGVVPACYYLAGAAAGLVAGSRNAWQAVCGKRPLRRPIMQSPIRYKVRLVDFLTAPVAASRASQAGGSLWSALDVSRGGGDGWGRSDGSEQSSPSSLAGKASPTHLGDRASSSHSPTAHGAKELYARGVDSCGKASPPLAAGGPGRAAWSSAVETRSPPSRRQREIQRSYQQQYQQALAGANLASEGRNAG